MIDTIANMQAETRINLHLIRHAVTPVNLEEHLICGRSNELDIYLPDGVQQSEAAAARFMGAAIAPDAVYASPAKRAQRTAELMLGAMGCGLPVMIDGNLQEMSQGEWEGCDRGLIYTEAEIAKIRHDPMGHAAPGGESKNQVLARGLDYLGRVVIDQGDQGERTVFAFAHGLMIRILAGSLLGWDAERMRTEKTPNTSDSLLVYQGGSWRAEYVGLMEPRQ